MDPLFFNHFCSVLVVFISTRCFYAVIDIFNILSERLHREHSNILLQIPSCLFSVRSLTLNDRDSVLSHLSSLIPDLLNLFNDKSISSNFHNMRCCFERLCQLYYYYPFVQWYDQIIHIIQSKIKGAPGRIM